MDLNNLEKPGTRGRQFWDETTTSFDLSDSERLVLLEVCRTINVLDRLAEAVERDGPTTLGASGQTVVHPAVGEGRAQRLALRSLLATLSIPDRDGDTLPGVNTTTARMASKAHNWASRSTPALKPAAG